MQMLVLMAVGAHRMRVSAKQQAAVLQSGYHKRYSRYARTCGASSLVAAAVMAGSSSWPQPRRCAALPPSPPAVAMRSVAVSEELTISAPGKGPCTGRPARQRLLPA
jgi:hypothetical protein